MIKPNKGNLIRMLDKGFLNGAVHQANCQNTMGSGIAKQLRDMWPEVYEADTRAAKAGINTLGNFSLAEVIKDRFVFNMYGQEFFGADKRYTDYEAFEKGMEAIKNWLEGTQVGSFRLGIPQKIGCDRAGGEWDVCEEIIVKVFDKSRIEVHIVEWDGTIYEGE